jgi:hypothetical protein
MSNAYYVGRARRVLEGKTVEELGLMLHQLMGEETPADSIAEMMREVGRSPQEREFLVDFLLQHCVIGVVRDEEEPSPQREEPKRKKGGSTLRFATMVEKIDMGNGLRMDLVSARECTHCGMSSAQVKLSACGKCHQCHYCSEECQKSHWKAHKSNCRSNK